MTFTTLTASPSEVQAAIERLMKTIPEVPPQVGLAACILMAYAMVNGEFPSVASSAKVIEETCAYFATWEQHHNGQTH